MPKILHIETSTTVCSVSLSENQNLLALREINEGYTHAENLHVFIQEVLHESHLTPPELNAVSVSKGPGSYTGLRIGVSTAKGLCYALGVPLISIDTLQLMASKALKQLSQNDALCPMLDARRMEVYTAVYDSKLNTLQSTEALIVDENSLARYHSFNKICFFGDGMPKCKSLLSQLPNASFLDDIVPSAGDMPVLAFQKFQNQQFEDSAYFEPFYLKDFLILKKKT